MKNQKGFTLIEVIVTLILVGIMASMAGMGIVSGVQGYLFAKDNAAISQKAQVAMARLNRTFTEVLGITKVETNPTSVTYNRLIKDTKVEETLYLDTTNKTLKIAGGGNLAGGDILVDHVASLDLSFFRGTDPWVTSDEFSLLSSVIVDLTLTRPDGGSDVSFTTSVTPRNNGNVGGEVPPSEPPPSSECFVATAAFGHVNHPMVIVLKEFRDRYLLTWSGGRTLVHLYYDKGPLLADQIRDNAWACILTQALLMPFVGVAFLMLHAVIVLPVVIGLFWTGLGFYPRFFSTGRRGILALPRSQKGGVLIGLIVTMVIFGFIGAAMISLTNTSTFSQMGVHSSQKAYYLAEAGMRYAASEFLAATDEAAKDDVLVALNDETFSMGNDGQFDLKIFPYYSKTTTDLKELKILKAKFPGSAHEDIPITANNGYLKLGSETVPRKYKEYALSDPNITFKMVDNLPSYDVNTSVLFVGQAQEGTLERTVNTKANLTLSSGEGAFPPINGTFTIGYSSDVYVYESRSENVLKNVRQSKDTGKNFSVNVDEGAFVTLKEFIQLDSTGTFGQGTPLAATRKVSYSLPIGQVLGGGGGQDEFTDNFDEDFSNWDTKKKKWFGSTDMHQIVDKSVKVTDTDSLGSYQSASLLAFNWKSTKTLDLYKSWESSNNLLNYDAQVKIKVSRKDYYMAGIVFRVKTDINTGEPDVDGNMYGVSFLRANLGKDKKTFFLLEWYEDRDGIPDDFSPAPASVCVGSSCPQSPMIVLWQKTSSGGRQWLAYKTLSPDDGVVDSNGYLKNWSTLLVRISEEYLDPSTKKDKYNDIQVYFSNASDYSRITNSSTQELKWPENDPSKFTIVQWEELNSAVTKGDPEILGTGIEADTIIRTSALITPDSGIFNHQEVGLSTFGDSSTSVYFDDFGIQIQTSASGQGQGFLPGIQQ